MTLFAEMNTAMNAAIVEFLADAVADFGAGVTVSGLFRPLYAEAFNGFIAGNAPTFEATSGSLSGIATGASVTILGAEYVVRTIKPDGQGMTSLVLEAV